MSGTGGRFYDENEAEEILRLAARDSGGQMDRERLLSMASELGITPEAVDRAEKHLASKRESEAAKVAEEKDRKEFRAHRRRELWSAVGSFFSINGLMVGIWWFTGAGYFWPMWVIFGMGFAPLSQ